MARKLLEGAFNLASYISNRWSIVPEDGTTDADLLRRDYWQNVARKLRPGDFIDVHAPDGSYYIELYVRASSRLEATVDIIRKHEFAKGASVELSDDGLLVKYRNPARRYGVVRQDGTVLRDGFQSEDMAIEWLRDHRKQMRAA